MQSEIMNEEKKLNKDIVLDIKNLNVVFELDTASIKAVNGVSFNIKKGETVCMVGETGSGKSVTAFSVVRLLGTGGFSNRARLKGDIVFKTAPDKEYHMLELDNEELQKIRGDQISMIYQEPMNSLNPVFTCGYQVAEVLIYKTKKSKKEAFSIAEELLTSVGIPDAKRVCKSYPHELSGGMKQRVIIAMALALNPVLLIADEPTTAIDVTIQAQILNLIKKIQKNYGTSIFFITHDVSVVAQLADKVVVMYAGRTVEIGSVFDIFENPLHPYTKGLLNSIPRNKYSTGEKGRLDPIPGTVPNPAALPAGCPFHPRCMWADKLCREKIPETEILKDDRSVMCWHWKDLYEVN